MRKYNSGYWVERKIITPRRLDKNSPYRISLSSKKEKELLQNEDMHNGEHV